MKMKMKMNGFGRAMVAFGLMLLALGCEKEDHLVEGPKLLFSSDTLVFNEYEIKTLFFTTKPASQGEFQVISFPSWVNVMPRSGFFENDIQEVSITSSISDRNPGFYRGALKIMTSLGIDSVVLKGYAGDNSMFYVPNGLSFNITERSKSLTLVNQGDERLRFTASASDDCIGLSPSVGEVPVGQSISIAVDLIAENLENGAHQSKIFLTGNGVMDSVVVPIDFFEERKIVLEAAVIDAEYSKVTDQLVYVSSNATLSVFDALSRATEEIKLDYLPTCVSISPDGLRAVVGHDGHLSLVDLKERSVLRVCNVTCKASDVVYGANDWAYVIPDSDLWERMHCIDLSDANSIETMHTGDIIYGRSKARLHPSGSFIYVATKRVSLGSVSKFDIRMGTASFLHKCPKSNQYSFDGDFWFSERGDRLFSSGRFAFVSSELEALDMQYSGTIAEKDFYISRNLRWVDHSDVTNRLYVLLDFERNAGVGIYSNVYVCSSVNLQRLSNIELEKFKDPVPSSWGPLYVAEPFFVFSSSSGAEIFVITRSVNSGLVPFWGLECIPV